MGKFNTVFWVTGTLFTIEGFIHYNIGAQKDPNENRMFVLPSVKETVKIVAVVVVFSLLSAAIIPLINKTCN